jgi:hypothetical protein
MILAHYDISTLEHKRVPLWWHKRGLQQTASGYGCKLATELMVKLPSSPRWRRVYVCCFSNAGTAYVLKGKDWIVIFGQPKGD